MDLYRSLRSRQPGQADSKPLFFALPEQQQALEDLLRSGAVQAVHDTLGEQLEHLIAARMPSATAEEKQAALDLRVGERRLEHHGVWVFYPWSSRLVHVLPKEEYRELRSDRNQYLILAEERQRLQGCSIGIVGLSVGQSIAACLAMEGVGGRFVLADMDQLDFSNLNRVYGGVHEVGLPKTVMAARHMWEVDPYLEIVQFGGGLHSDNMEAFFDGLDLVVEECDNVIVKLRVREEAKRRGLPVLMATSDRGMLDVERFDEEPNRPVFHGILGDVGAEEMAKVPPQDRLIYLEAMADMSGASARTVASLLEMRESISTWPQLASSVVMGAGAITHLARRVLLNAPEHHVPSGRFFVDLDVLIAEENRAATQPVQGHKGNERAPLPELVAEAVSPQAASRDQVRALVARGCTAPSAGNTQPWRFRWSQGGLEVHFDPTVNRNVLDPHGRADRMAIGAALENIDLAASTLGWSSRVEQLGACAWRMSFTAGQRAPHPLRLQIDHRRTHRYIDAPEPIPDAVLEALSDAAAHHGGIAEFRSDKESLDRIVQVQAEAARIGLFGPTLHAKMIEEFRFTPEEALQSRTGQDLAAADVPEVSKVVLRMLRNRGALDLMAEQGLGGGLGKMTELWLAGASTTLVLRGKQENWDGIEAGRIVQRVWLEATAQGWALQPLGWASFMFERVRAGDENLLFRRALLEELEQIWTQVWPKRPGYRDIFFFRLVKAREQPKRSLRLNLDDVLKFGETQ